MLVEKKKRSFLPGDFNITEWSTLQPVFVDLKSRELSTFEKFSEWLRDLDELSSALEEEFAWSYINMTVDTSDEKASSTYAKLTSEISPKISPYTNELNIKLIESEFTENLTDKASSIWLKNVRTSLELYREENISLNSEIQALTQKYSALCGGLSVDFEGKTLTMPAAGAFLQNSDRNKREKIFEKIADVRNTKKDELNEIFNGLVKKRHQIASNAGFENFRDYKFRSLGRWDFSAKDCFDFHDSIAKLVTPVVNEIYESKKENLNLKKLRPFDTSAPAKGKLPLKPFKEVDELIQKSIRAFGNIDKYFGDALSEMLEKGHLNLASKPGKSPGGYNYPLYESGAPFIFMNAVGTHRDLVTMMHEGGHAIHSFLTHDLKYSVFKSCPSEVAELASMSMELISMDQWHLFYEEEAELKQAKKDHLQDAILALPWIAMVDKFQHWIYENPDHSNAERTDYWLQLNKELGNNVVNWEGFEETRLNSWQKQLHIFELPFYYIEYGMAQLGAIAVWKNYKENPVKTIEDYKNALSAGYTTSVPEIYQLAGIKFNFSEDYIKELIEFLLDELNKI